MILAKMIVFFPQYLTKSCQGLIVSDNTAVGNFVNILLNLIVGGLNDMGWIGYIIQILKTVINVFRIFFMIIM